MSSRISNCGFLICFALATASPGLAGPDEPSGSAITGSANGKVYHIEPKCSAARKISAESRVTFASVAEAESQGRRLCKVCERLRAKQNKPAEPAKEAEPSEPAKEQQPGDGGSPKPREPNPARSASPAKVRKVLPGGTLVLESGDKVRLMGITCPAEGQPMAGETVAAIEKRVRGHAVAVEYFKAEDGTRLRDLHGRALVLLGLDEKRPDLGAELILLGLAWVDRDGAFPNRPLYLGKESEAAASNIGIWRRLDGPAGQEAVVCGKFARQFHPTNCPHIEHMIDPLQITLNEARARRLVPCDRFRADSSGSSPSSAARPSSGEPRE